MLAVGVIFLTNFPADFCNIRLFHFTIEIEGNEINFLHCVCAEMMLRKISLVCGGDWGRGKGRGNEGFFITKYHMLSILCGNGFA